VLLLVQAKLENYGINVMPV